MEQTRAQSQLEPYGFARSFPDEQRPENCFESGMGLSHVAVIAAISLSGLLPSSCSKQPAPPAQHNKVVVTNSIATNTAPAAAAPSKTRDLGVIQLTNHFEREIDLGNGRTFTIVPRAVDRRNVALTLSFGIKDPGGKMLGLSVTRVTAQTDKPFEITVNDEDMTFTPKVAY